MSLTFVEKEKLYREACFEELNRNIESAISLFLQSLAVKNPLESDAVTVSALYHLSLLYYQIGNIILFKKYNNLCLSLAPEHKVALFLSNWQYAVKQSFSPMLFLVNESPLWNQIVSEFESRIGGMILPVWAFKLFSRTFPVLSDSDAGNGFFSFLEYLKNEVRIEEVFVWKSSFCEIAHPVCDEAKRAGLNVIIFDPKDI